MFTSQTQIRIRYAETDKMGYVYYGNYAQFYEVGRVEALRNLGFTYKKLEEEGIMLPVYDLQSKFFRPAFYDDLLTIETTIIAIKGARIIFTYRLYRENQELINEGQTTLVFVNFKTRIPCPPPSDLLEALAKYSSKV